MITFEDVAQGGRLEGKFDWVWNPESKHHHVRVKTHSFTPCGIEVGFGLSMRYARHPVCPKCMEYVIAESVIGVLTEERGFPVVCGGLGCLTNSCTEWIKNTCNIGDKCKIDRDIVMIGHVGNARSRVREKGVLIDE